MGQIRSLIHQAFEGYQCVRLCVFALCAKTDADTYKLFTEILPSFMCDVEKFNTIGSAAETTVNEPRALFFSMIKAMRMMELNYFDTTTDEPYMRTLIDDLLVNIQKRYGVSTMNCAFWFVSVIFA